MIQCCVHCNISLNFNSENNIPGLCGILDSIIIANSGQSAVNMLENDLTSGGASCSSCPAGCSKCPS